MGKSLGHPLISNIPEVIFSRFETDLYTIPLLQERKILGRTIEHIQHIVYFDTVIRNSSIASQAMA